MIHLATAAPAGNGLATGYYWIGIILGLGAIGGWVVVQARKVQKRSRTIDDLIDWAFGKEPSRANEHPAPGADEVLSRLDLSVARIEASLKPNGGHTKQPGDQLENLRKDVTLIMQHLGIDK